MEATNVNALIFHTYVFLGIPTNISFTLSFALFKDCSLFSNNITVQFGKRYASNTPRREGGKDPPSGVISKDKQLKHSSII
ncbi:hypothetical protein V1478_012929 [Vespula squamosa]|uniref:Uncharacterized protein n=1 Tax=Vespula squamosa TaxID=30214 RepID=A0ABD2A9D3_VESSQ